MGRKMTEPARRRAAAVLFVLSGACAGESGETNADHRRVETTESRWVRATAPTSRSILEAPAKVVAQEVASGEVTVLFPARVQAILVAPGDAVKVGQRVVEVVMPEFNRAAATIVGIDAQLGLVSSRLEALTRLRVEKLVRAEELFELRSTHGRLVAARAEAHAVMKSCGANPSQAASFLRAGRLTLTAPVDGTVTAVNVRLGQYAAEGAPLVEILGARRGRVEATLTAALPADARLELVLADGRTFALESDPVGNVVDPVSGQMRVWFTMTKPEPLAAGLRGRLRVRPRQGTLVQIPSAALVPHDDVVEVYVVEQGQPVLRRVTVASDSGTSALVSGPIQVGALVVVDPDRSERKP